MQQWVTDYPYLAYNINRPGKNQIIVINMSKDGEQQLIDLGDMQFVSFVKHSTYAETEIFSNRYEFVRNIMVLVKMETVEEEKK